jgi:hypothetical protein
LYLPVYRNIEKEIIELSYNIHFSNDQLGVYSVKIAELLLRISTEVESLSKDIYIKKGYNVKNKEKDRLKFDYDCIKKIDEDYKICDKIVMVSNLNIFFNDEHKCLTPLKGITQDRHIEDNQGNKTVNPDCSKWKCAYMGLKHNRAESLNLATVENLLNAAASLFLLNVIWEKRSLEILNYVKPVKEADEYPYRRCYGSSLFCLNTTKSIEPQSLYTSCDVECKPEW